MTMIPAYRGKTPRSGRIYERAKRVFAGGVSHNARFYDPYPIFVSKARGQHVWDEDGNRYTDYWMGHMALILGHSPAVVVRALEEQVKDGTHFGLGSLRSIELAEEIQRTVPCAELMRFCNTGAEATMYLVRLARAYSRKKVIVKMAGGWHGYNTELNKGVRRPFDRSESEGILPEEQAYVRLVTFNSIEAVERAVREARDDVAAILLEPVLGAGGCIPANREYLKALRELTDRTGTILAFDEIITGFRLALGGAQEWYRVKPDLAALGKVAGGGLPLGMVCGRKEIVSLADPTNKDRFVSIGGGTFSENPLSMSAGLATIRYLRRNSGTIYPSLGKRGDRIRAGVDASFKEEGIETHTTGIGSLFLTHFGVNPTNAEATDAEDSRAGKEYALYLMTNGIFKLPGHPGGVSTAHTQKDIEELVETSGEFASLMRANRR